MRKKFIAIYALAGALVASPVFTSCVDDTVSPQVEAQREANIKYKNAQTASLEAQTAINQANAALDQEAKRIQNEYNAANNAHQKTVWAYNEAINAYNLANRAYEEAKKEANKALQEEIDSLSYVLKLEQAKNSIEQAKRAEEEAKIALEEAKIRLESSKRTEALAAAKAELELEKAMIEAEKNLLDQKKNLITSQNNLDKELAKLDEKVKGEAQQLNKNAQAIMMGGTFTKSDGDWINYNSTYGTGYNSIIALMDEIAKENVNLIKYEAKLIDVEAYVKEQTAKQNQKIAIAEATIANYEALQKDGSYDAVKAKYDEACNKVSTMTNEQAAATTAQQEAKEAFVEYVGAEFENDVYAYIASQLAENGTVAYMTPQTKRSNNNVLEADIYVYDTSSNLDTDITTAETNVTTAEGDITTRETAIENYKKTVAENIVDLERSIAIEKAALKDLQDKQAALKAEAGYATFLATLTDAVTAAKTAFEAEPTQPNKAALETAEANLAAADQNYPTPGVGVLTIADYEVILKENGGQDTDGDDIEDEDGNPIGYEAYVEEMEFILEALKALEEDADFELLYMAENSLTETLEDLKQDLADAEEALAKLEALKEMFAEDSEAMVAYQEWVEGLEAKIEAYDDYAYDTTDLTAWELLMNSLDDYVTIMNNSGTVTLGSLDYAKLIEEQNTIITNAKAAIAQLGYVDENGNEITTMTYEDMIKNTEAKIAAMEAEQEIRQAEYDAIMKELDALVNAETEAAE